MKALNALKVFKVFDVCKIITVFILTIILVPTPAAAASSKLAWSEAISLMQQNGLELQAMKNTVAAQEKAMQGSRANFLPQVSLQANGSDNKNDQLSTKTYSTSLNLSQNLFNGFGDVARYKQSEANFLALQQKEKALKAKLSLDLATAYAHVFYYQKLKIYSEKVLLSRNENLSMVELRYETGHENKGSVLQAKAYSEQAKLELSQAKNAEELARNSLQKLLNLDEILGVQDQLPVLNIVEGQDWSKVVESSAEIQQKELEIQATRQALSVQEAANYPTLALNASIGKQGPEWAPSTDHQSVGLVLTLPLFEGGRDHYGALQIQQTLFSSEKLLQKSKLDLQIKLKSAFQQAQDAARKFEIDLEFLRAAQIRSEIARGKYTTGLLSFEEWDLVEGDVINKNKSVLISEKDRFLSAMNYLTTQGQGVIE